MHIHARALKYFDMIRRCGSIREAARQLHIASSAANRQLLQLEAEVGAPLFDRLSSGLKLTPTGEILSRHVVTVLQDAQRMSSELDALKGIRSGALDVIAAEGLTSDFLPNVFGHTMTRYPSVRINARSAGPEKMMEAVINGDADVAIGFALPRTKELQQFAMGRFKLGAIMTHSHPLAKLSQVSFAECAQYPLIIARPELSIHTVMKELIARHKPESKIVMETGSIELMKGLAARGIGVAFQTRLGIEREVRTGLLAHVPIKAPRSLVVELAVFVRAGRSLPPALDAFVHIVADEIRRRVSEEP